MRHGLAILAVAPAIQIPLAAVDPVGLLAAWLVALVGLLACRDDPLWSRGVRAGIAAWAVLAAGTVLGFGLTVGTQAGPLVSGGGFGSGVESLAALALYVTVVPLGLVLASGATGTARAAARLGVLLLAVSAAALVATFAAYAGRLWDAPVTPGFFLVLTLLGGVLLALGLVPEVVHLTRTLRAA